jgi:Sec-independent protein translocase protein TatA
MFGIGFSELGLLAVIVFLVVSPEEVPVLLRKVGRVVGALRGIGAKFREESGIDELSTEWRDAIQVRTPGEAPPEQPAAPPHIEAPTATHPKDTVVAS